MRKNAYYMYTREICAAERQLGKFWLISTKVFKFLKQKKNEEREIENKQGLDLRLGNKSSL